MFVSIPDRIAPTVNSLRRLFRLIAVVVVVAWGASVQVHAQDQPTLDPERALSQYVLDVWTTDDGLPQNTIVSLAQTRDGYLWLGTQEGLVRFDGLHFTTYTQEIPNPFVSALHEDAAGILWVGTYGGGLARYEGGRFTSQTIDGVPDGHISAITSGTDGSLWVGAFGGGLVRVSGEQTRTFSTVDGAPTSGITALATDATGAVWIGTLTEGLVRFADGRFTRITSADGLSADEVRSLHIAEDGTLWVATEGGVDHLVQGRLVPTPAASALSDAAPRTILSDSKGTLWVGTQQQGLVRLHADRAERMTAASGLPHDAISLLYEDLEGSLWIGTDGGLARLHGGRVVTYSTTEGLAHPVVLSVYEDAQGAVWMGTEGGGLGRLKDGRITTLTTADGLPSDVILAVRGTQDGSLWIGTHRGGLARLKDGRISTFTVADGLPSASIFALYEDRAGTLWLGTSNGLGRYRDGRFSTLTTADGLSNDLITVMTEDAEGRLWVGTYEGGLNVLEDDRVVAQVSTKNGLPSDLILSLHAGSDGVLWSGTQNGISRVDTREGFAVHTFTAAQGLQSSTVLQVLEDARGWLWMSSNRGLSRVHTSDFEAVIAGERALVTPTPYGHSDGLRSEEFNGGVQPAGWQGQDGALWFPTTDGVVAIDPAHLPDYPLASTRIETLLANGAVVDLGSAGELAPDRRRLTFRYAAPSFLAPERIHYRYRLEGVDEQWVEAGPRREAFYTNLGPGAYTFRVQAINADGAPGPIASLPLRIEPYFYEAGWFRALCALTVLLLLRLVYGARVRFLKTRQRELEALVETRTDELRRTNVELAATSEIKTQLMHVVAHDLKNPLNGVHGLAQVLREELPEDIPQQELVHLIEKAAEEMLVMVISFLDAEAIDSQGNVLLAIERLDIRDLARNTVERFQGQALHKDQVLTFEPPPSADYTIEGDAAWLKEVFDNLVSNAVKYTPLGKRIHVRVAHREDDDGRYVRFEVQDEGPGLTDEDMGKMFERFQRLSAQPTAEESSMGLGLYIVKGIVQRHNGRVWAESEVDVGSTFIVEFEAAAPDPPAPTLDEHAHDVAVPAIVVSEEAALTSGGEAWPYDDAFVLDSGHVEGMKPATAPSATPSENATLAATFKYID